MSAKIPFATHVGIIEIGDAKIPCAVLDDGRRVLTESGISESLGSRTGGAKKIKREAVEGGWAPLPIFVAPKGLKPFISSDLESGLTNPLKFRQGNRIVMGFEATLLPQVCDVWLKARDAGALQAQQLARAQKADMLMRGLAHIGIIALVDEVTGYEEVRDRLALQAILDAYLRKELAAWAKRFPDEFYRQMFRLRGWQWRAMSVSRPSIVGKYTNDLVYERLADGIMDELQRRNPKDEKGQRQVRHHQWLTADVGHPALAQHLHAVIGFMRASSTWDQFYRLLQRAFPKKGQTIPMPFDD